MEPAGAQTTGLASGRDLEEGKDTCHGGIVGFLEKPVLDPEFHVAGTKQGWSVGRTVKGKGREKMELKVLYRPVVGLEMGGRARKVAPVVLVFGCRVEFPVPVIDRLGVVGAKGRPGKCGGCLAQGAKDEEGSEEPLQPPPACSSPARPSQNLPS